MPPETTIRATGAITPLTAADFARLNQADGIAGFLAHLAAQYAKTAGMFRTPAKPTAAKAA